MDAGAATVAVSRRAADRLRAGHSWVYRSDLVVTTAAPPPAGAVVTVADARGLPLGSGIYSSASEIAVRLLSREPGMDRTAFLETVSVRLRHALALRRALVPEVDWDGASETGTNACRLVFSEADGLPGIIVDRYAGLVILQLLTQGTAQADVRAAVIEALAAEPWAQTIVERGDARLRELEQIELPAAEVLWARTPGQDALHTRFALNGLWYGFDAGAGQKTGAFLDQRQNYARAAAWALELGATGRALDVCTYQGGFALHLARVVRHVTGVDASRAALEVADRNLEANAAAVTAAVDWVEADAFELLRAWQQAGEQFDTVVLDPPAFAKSRRAAEGALRGYKELNLRAMRMLRPGGLLVTCSCSFHVGPEEFTQVVREAAADAGRPVQLLETRGAAPDHPALLTLPETRYLKCLVCRVG